MRSTIISTECYYKKHVIYVFDTVESTMKSCEEVITSILRCISVKLEFRSKVFKLPRISTCHLMFYNQSSVVIFVAWPL